MKVLKNAASAAFEAALKAAETPQARKLEIALFSAIGVAVLDAVKSALGL